MVDSGLYVIMRDLFSLEFSISNVDNSPPFHREERNLVARAANYSVSARALHVSNILMLVLATAVEACQGLVSICLDSQALN